MKTKKIVKMNKFIFVNYKSKRVINLKKGTWISMNKLINKFINVKRMYMTHKMQKKPIKMNTIINL